MTAPLSILDLATIGKGQTAAESFAGSVAMAQLAERLGYRRVWYAEHHNMSSIASSATSVLIAHVATHTNSIRLGAGGIMLPNHSPLTIAEQFGTLETLHPGRIDLGLGRAPGSDQNTMRALRRDHMAADTFPQDVLELQGYLTGPTRIQGVEATPGKGTNVPLYILGSSLFGARLAARLGLPYAFASHFAPNALQDAVAIYRREFKPSEQLAEPYVIAGVNVIAADSAAEAQELFQAVKRARVSLFFGGGREFTDDEADMILDSPQGQHVAQMVKYSAVGAPEMVREYLDEFTAHADADELIVAHQTTGIESRLRSVELLAQVVGLVNA
ncbi:LLM class flavin-dependent oxidoreductase [Arthrobacter sp. ISL-30]|uniref:LLM class flavin-dependent oxidoreductase n=1 Tax=Arthrobacter sp. ISL-30 TaxID=2819109 RepID=UPI001BED3253|nr:LLM class flavin-dependent oxidoreductase [Arthrobacter sp. ISL-30]MBT2512225.1 LLM class flavin-dependent oxidoreductase [Arthrobacter sp. ISL-30]